MMSDEVWQRFFQQPQRVGAWLPAEPQIGTGWAGSPREGNLLRLQIQVRDGRIIDTRFKAFGHPWTIVTGAFTAETLVTKYLDDALALEDSFICTTLGVPPLHIRSAVLAVEACRAAVVNFREKSAVDNSNG